MLSGNASCAPVGATWLSPDTAVTDAARGPLGSLELLHPTTPIAAASAKATKPSRPFIGSPLPGRRDDTVEYFAVADHTELLAGDALLHGGIRFEVVGELGERVELDAEGGHLGALVNELAANRDPVRGAVFPPPHGERAKVAALRIELDTLAKLAHDL